MPLEKLKKCVLAKAFDSVDGHRLISAADIDALRLVVRAMMDGNMEAAAVEAGATDLSLEVWEAALIAVKNS